MQDCTVKLWRVGGEGEAGVKGDLATPQLVLPEQVVARRNVLLCIVSME